MRVVIYDAETRKPIAVVSTDAWFDQILTRFKDRARLRSEAEATSPRSSRSSPGRL